jgi:hypothetical protein
LLRKSDSRPCHLLDVLARDGFKGLGGQELLADLLLTLLECRVTACSHRMACLVGRFSRLLQTDVRIAPDRQLLFNLADPIPKSPEFADILTLKTP